MLGTRLILLATAALLADISLRAADEMPLDVGSERQLFVDGLLIARMNNLRQVLHRPVRREIAIKAEHPWEKYGVSYMVTFRDQQKFRAWYRCDAADFNRGKRRSMTAYAESHDGIHWRKPKLGIFEFNGSKQNNILWAGPGANMAPFRDDNPNCKPDERYKAIVRSSDVLALVSPDGLDWRLLREEPIMTNRPFDSHNIAFWDSRTKQYVAYTRGVRRQGKLGPGHTRSFLGGVRWIRRSTSKDFIHWTPLELIETGDAPLEHLYTNATARYQRAPGYLLMFPSRFVNLREPLPGWIGGKGVNDIAFLSSRDGIHFDRTFLEAFVRPGSDQGNWHERALYMERGILQTSPHELSMYAMQNWRLDSVHIRRLTLRPDGFVSIRASYRPGELLTRPILFSGKQLRLNYSTSAGGAIEVEIQDQHGEPIPGFRLTDCPEIFGDKLDAAVRWKTGAELAKLAGRPVRLRFAMRDADLYAFRFTK